MHEQEYVLSEEDMHALSSISSILGALTALFGNFLAVYTAVHFGVSPTLKNVVSKVREISQQLEEADNKGASENAGE